MGKPVKAIKKIGKKVLPIAATIAGSFFGGPVGAAIGSGVGTKLSGGSIKDSLISAGGSYFGSSIGGKLLPDSIGSIGGIGGKVGPYSLSSGLGGIAGNALNQVANTSIGSALGGFYGPNIANSLFGDQEVPEQQIGAQAAPTQSPIAEPEPFKAMRENQLNLPGSLGGYGEFSPEQQSSNLATQGVYGGGLGPEEESYFTNLINRRLVDDAGQVDTDFSEVSPIENSYLSQLGIGGYSNPSDLLEALSGRRKQSALRA